MPPEAFTSGGMLLLLSLADYFTAPAKAGSVIVFSRVFNRRAFPVLQIVRGGETSRLPPRSGQQKLPEKKILYRPDEARLFLNISIAIVRNTHKSTTPPAAPPELPFEAGAIVPHELPQELPLSPPVGFSVGAALGFWVGFWVG